MDVYGNIKHLRESSSVAEQAAHNRLVEGSNPSGPIKIVIASEAWRSGFDFDFRKEIMTFASFAVIFTCIDGLRKWIQEMVGDKHYRIVFAVVTDFS